MRPDSSSLRPSFPQSISGIAFLAFKMFCSNASIFLRTAAIFLIPTAALLVFVPTELTTVPFAYSLVWPVVAMADLSLISLCVGLLRGRPLSISQAIRQALSHLLSYLGMVIVRSIALGVVILVAAIPLFLGFINGAVVLSETREAAFAMSLRNQAIITLLALREIYVVSEPSVVFGVVAVATLFYLRSRWLVTEIALVVEDAGSLKSLYRSWEMSKGFALRSTAYFVVVSIVLSLIANLGAEAIKSVTTIATSGSTQIFDPGVITAISVLFSVVTTPLYICAMAVYFFDLRHRKGRRDS